MYHILTNGVVGPLFMLTALGIVVAIIAGLWYIASG